MLLTLYKKQFLLKNIFEVGLDDLSGITETEKYHTNANPNKHVVIEVNIAPTHILKYLRLLAILQHAIDESNAKLSSINNLLAH